MKLRDILTGRQIQKRVFEPNGFSEDFGVSSQVQLCRVSRAVHGFCDREIVTLITAIHLLEPSQYLIGKIADDGLFSTNRNDAITFCQQRHRDRSNGSTSSSDKSDSLLGLSCKLSPKNIATCVAMKFFAAAYVLTGVLLGFGAGGVIARYLDLDFTDKEPTKEQLVSNIRVEQEASDQQPGTGRFKTDLTIPTFNRSVFKLI